MGALLDIAIKAAASVRGGPDTPAQAELRRLVPLFAAHCRFSKEDAEEALQVALEHPDNSLPFYRGKVKQLRLGGVEAV